MKTNLASALVAGLVLSFGCHAASPAGAPAGSTGHAGKDSAEGGLASVQANCSEDSGYERKTLSDGKAFFKLKAANHPVIGTSQMYSSESSREAGISGIKANGTTTAVEDDS
jgi:uncharacterized protein